MTFGLSIVMPVHNEAAHLASTMDALATAVERSGFEDVEVVVVDDGSSDGSADTCRDALGDRIPLRIVSQPNRGRFEARKAGLAAARGDWVLLLDGRVRMSPGALEFVRSRLGSGEFVWNAHVDIETDGNPYGVFWDVLVRLAWSDYFANPRATSFDAETFDRYPKGTSGFFAPRALLLQALAEFDTRYRNLRFANDDTIFIRWIAERERIHLSPEYACEYIPRGELRSFLRHAYHRGTVFLDGHGRVESRFFGAVLAFYPVSAGLGVAALRRPWLIPALGGACAVAAAAVATRATRSRYEIGSFAALAPVYAVAHGGGMWRGLVLAARDRIARAS